MRADREEPPASTQTVPNHIRMPVIIIRPRAKSDLAEIWDYIANDSEAHADIFVEKIDEKFKTLAAQPYTGRRRNELGEGLRSFPVGRYVIFYRPLEDGVEIIRVLHDTRDLDAVFHYNEGGGPA